MRTKVGPVMVTSLSILLNGAPLAGCGSKKDSPTQEGGAPKTSETVRGAPLTWTLRYEARCASLPREQCLAAFGFSLFSDRRFRFGPGPKGEHIDGFVEDSREIRRVAEALSAALRKGETDVKGHGSCVEEKAPLPLEVLVVASGVDSATRIVLGPDSAGVCPAADPEARELRDAVRAVAESHAPEKFPNPCVEASVLLERAYDEVRRCKRDDDCAYIGEGLLPETGSAALSLSDDCSYLPVLLAANSFETVANQLSLLLRRDLARQICGAETRKPGCRWKAVPAGLGPATCAAGMCQAAKFN